MSDFDKQLNALKKKSSGSDFDKRVADIAPPEPDEPISIQQKAEILRRLGRGITSPGGIDVNPAFKPRSEKAYDNVMSRELDAHARLANLRINPNKLTKKQADQLISELDPVDEATIGEQATKLAGSFVEGMHAPALGITEWLAKNLRGTVDDKVLDEALAGARGVANPSRSTLGRERYGAASRALQSTFLGRVAEGGAHLLGAAMDLKAGSGALGKMGAGRATGSINLGLYSGLSEMDVKAGLQGAAFGYTAGVISAPLEKWLKGLPVVRRREALQVLGGKGVGAVSFAGADAILNGPDGERALQNAIFGMAMQGRIKAKPTQADLMRGFKGGAQKIQTVGPEVPGKLRGPGGLQPSPALEAMRGELGGGMTAQPAKIRGKTRATPLGPDAAQPLRGPGGMKPGRSPDFEGGLSTGTAPERAQPRKPTEQTPRDRALEILDPRSPAAFDPGKPHGEQLKRAARALAEDSIVNLRQEATRLGLSKKGNIKQLSVRIAREYMRNPPVAGEAARGPSTTKAGATPAGQKVELRGEQKIDVVGGDREIRWGRDPIESTNARMTVLNERTGEVAKKTPKRMSNESGMLLMPDVEAVKTVFKAAGSGVGAVGKEFGSVLGALERQGVTGVESSLLLHEVARVTVTERAKIRKTYESAKREIGANKENKEAVESLSEFRLEPGKIWGTSKTHMKGEGKEAKTEAEAKVLDPMMETLAKAGEMAEAAGVPGFKTRGDRVPYYPTEVIRDIVAKGSRHPDWENLNLALREAMGPHEAIRFIEGLRESVAVSDYAGLDRKASFERKRTFEKLPTYLKSNGKKLVLFETEPIKIIDSIWNRGTRRLAFGRVFGFGKDGAEPRTLTEMREEIKKSGNASDVALFDGAMQLAQGSSFEPPKGMVDPGASSILRMGHALSNLAKAAVLSRAWKAAAMEPVGPIAQTFGHRRVTKSYFKAIYEAAREAAGKAPSATTEALRDAGMVERHIPVRNRGGPHKMTNAVNRAADVLREVGLIGPASRVLNDRTASYAAKDWLDNVIMAGKGGRQDARSIEIFGRYSRKDAQRLAAGKGTTAEYNDMMRRMVGNMVGGHALNPVESSVIQNRNWFRLIPFTQYATTQLRTEIRQVRTLAESIQRGPKDAAVGVYQYAKHLAGRTAQSALWQLLGHTIAGGSLDEYLDRWENNPDGEAFTALFMAMIAGSYGQVATSFVTEEGLGEAALSSIWSVGLASDFLDFATLSDRYEGQTRFESMGTAIKRWLPMSKDVLTLYNLVGLGGEDGEEREVLHRARREFYRLRYGTLPGRAAPLRKGKLLTEAEEKKQRELMISVRRAVKAAREFKGGEAVVAELQRALKVATPQEVRAKLLARRIWGTRDDPKSQLSSEESRLISEGGMSDDLIGAILRHDRRLESLADWVYTPDN